MNPMIGFPQEPREAITPSRAIHKVRALITSPRDWTRGNFVSADLAGGHKRYCVMGAFHTLGLWDSNKAALAEEAISELYPNNISISPVMGGTRTALIAVNDRLGHKAVLKVLDRMYEIAKAREELSDVLPADLTETREEAAILQ